MLRRPAFGREAVLVWLLAGLLVCAGALAAFGSQHGGLAADAQMSPAEAAGWGGPIDWSMPDPDDDLVPGAANRHLALLATWLLFASSGLAGIRPLSGLEPAARSLFAQQTMLLR